MYTYTLYLYTYGCERGARTLAKNMRSVYHNLCRLRASAAVASDDNTYANEIIIYNNNATSRCSCVGLFVRSLLSHLETAEECDKLGCTQRAVASIINRTLAQIVCRAHSLQSGLITEGKRRFRRNPSVRILLLVCVHVCPAFGLLAQQLYTVMAR